MPADLCFCCLITGIAVTGMFDTIFRGWNVVHALVYACVITLLLMTWLVILVIRCISFVLQLAAAVQAMPEAAARIVSAIGKQP